VSRILIVEDEKHLADGLRFNLEAEEHEVEVAYDGEHGLELLHDANAPFDAVVLDVMLPGKSGFEVAKELRQQKRYVPILMLTARGRSEDVLTGFEAGADDYLQKPFELDILLARLRALLRRHQWAHGGPPSSPPDRYEFSGRVVDFNAMELHHAKNIYPLTAMESDLLRFLIKNAGTTVSRKELLENVWGLHEDTDTRAIDNFMVRLRRYIEDDPGKPKFLRTVRGVGYRFSPSA